MDANLRNEAVHSLRFMHNAFFTLSAEAFCKAVNLIDRFIVKVKVELPFTEVCLAISFQMLSLAGLSCRLSQSTWLVLPPLHITLPRNWSSPLR